MTRSNDAGNVLGVHESVEVPPVLERVDFTQWAGTVEATTQQRALEALERGRVLVCPTLACVLETQERQFLSPSCTDGSAKNISFDPQTGQLRGSGCKGDQQAALVAMLARYATQALGLVQCLLPGYQHALEQARTSYRPIPAEGRVSSYKQDDRRLHIDAFPSRPTQGQRILRVFTNVHPAGAP